jgi:LacI family transcriptional regulator
VATIKDVAEKAGVSIGTVDRIIHNRGRFSQKTAKKVKKIIHDLDYRTNIQARNLSLSKQCSIAVLIPHPDQDSNYWQLPYNGMRTALEELATSHVSADFFHFDRHDKDTLFQALNMMAEKEYDAYVAAPLIPDEFLESYEDIFQSKPVVFFDTDIENSHRLLYIGQDSREAGHLAAKLINLLCHNKKMRVLIVTPATENDHLTSRILGFRERVTMEHDIIRIPTDNSNAVETYAEIKDQLKSKYQAVYVTDSSSHQIASLIKERNLNSDVALVGYDLVEKNIEYTKRGVIDFILTQRPFEQGYLSIKSLYQKVILGTVIQKEHFMPIDIITAENISCYVESLSGKT